MYNLFFRRLWSWNYNRKNNNGFEINMNQQQTLLTQAPADLPQTSRETPEKRKEKEEMVKIPVLGTIDSATGKITFYKNNKKLCLQ